MAANPCSASTLPWLWVTEALANFKEVDASVLIGLIKRIPEISDDIGRNTREIVSLRILESLFARRVGPEKGAFSVPLANIGFDMSERCEDVLRRIIHEMPASDLRAGRPEMSKWDVDSFIRHKSVLMPKPALQQLKDAILEGRHPFPASLKERSGLAARNQSEYMGGSDPNDVNTDGRTMAAEGNLISSTHEDGGNPLQEDSRKRSSSPAKRGGSISTEIQLGQFHESQIYMDNCYDPHTHAAKKLKQDSTSTSQVVRSNSVSLHGNELIQICSGREASHLERESRVGGLVESGLPMDGNGVCVPSTRLEQSSDIENVESLHERPKIPFDDNKGHQDTSGDGLAQNISVDNAKDDSKGHAEMRKSNGSPSNATLKNIHGDEDRQRGSNCEPPTEAKDKSSDSERFDFEKTDIAMMKHKFLSSQCTYSQDSLATANFTELNLCMKCNKSGQLLVCNTIACPIVIHESCLSSAASFDDMGKFYCPFCTYSQAISEYLKFKKKVSLARKDLAAFIGLGTEHQPMKNCNRSESEQNQLGLDEKNEANDMDNYVNQVDNYQSRINAEDRQKAEPSVSCLNDNLPSGEKGANIIARKHCILMEDTRGKEMGQECQSPNRPHGQQTEVHDFGHHQGDDSFCRATEIAPESGKHVEVGLQQENVDAGESSEDKSTTSTYSIRFRKRETQYTYPVIPQLRRRKVPWTKMEEEMLKEGVQRFSSVHDKSIPWKKILEFGGNVFQKGRTTIDLKDKWRNICRGSPKSK